MPDHGPVAGVDLSLFSRRSDDHRMCLGGPLAPELGDEAADTGVPAGEAVIVDEESCQIAMALRPQARACSMSSR
jgi:hypothetical protein